MSRATVAFQPYGIESLEYDPDTLAGTFRTRQGVLVRVRLIRPDDAPLLVDLFRRLSPESRRRRFNVALENIEEDRLLAEARRLAAVDNCTQGGAVLALVEEAGGERVVGVARLGRDPSSPTSPVAEAALVVRDDYHNQGVGTALMAMLAQLARRMGVRTLTATVQADNEPMFTVLQKLSLPLETHHHHGEVDVWISVADLGREN